MGTKRLLVALSLCIILSLGFMSGCTQDSKENTAESPVTAETENSTEEVSTVEESDDTDGDSEEEEQDNTDEDSEEEEQRRLKEEERKNNIYIESVKVGKSQVKLSWSPMERGTGCRVYRYDETVEDRNEQSLLVTLSKDTYSYIDRDVAVGKRYTYEVIRIDEQTDGTVELLSLDSQEVDIGPGSCGWIDTGPTAYGIQADTTTRYIRLQFGVSAYAMKQDGFEIYRGKRKKDMKRIAVVESAKKHATYKDTDVTPFASCYYKVRSYKKIDGKTYYGAFNEKRKYTAINSIGKFVIEKGTDWKQEQKEHIIKMSSDQGNYDFELDKYLFSITGGPDYGEEELWNYQISNEFKNVQYSFDGTNWKNLTKKKVKVSKGESIYLLLRKKGDQVFRLDTKIYAACYYQSYPAVLQIDFRKDSPIGEAEYEYTG